MFRYSKIVNKSTARKEPRGSSAARLTLLAIVFFLGALLALLTGCVHRWAFKADITSDLEKIQNEVVK